jgi:hypothetical protein
MGDNINIDYSHAGYVPDFGNALMQGFNSGRQMTIDRATDQARANAAANPDDLDAITHLAVYDQNAARAYADRISMQRAASFRQAAGSYIGQNFPTSGQNAFAPQGSSVAQPQNAPPMAGPPNAMAPQPSAPIAPGGQPGFADAMGSAMQGIPGAPPAPPQPQAGGMAPQGAPQPQQAQQTPLADPRHPINVEAGQAVAQGQPFNALAAMYQADPDGADKMVTAVSNLDKLRRDKLGESSGAIGSEAQALLNVPLQNRASELQRIAPMLLQHGVTPQQIQSAIQGGLSDNLLHGLIGQATTVQQAIDQSNKLVEQGLQDRTTTTAENSQSETVRHNRMDENQGVVVQNPLGGSSLVRRSDGALIYNNDGSGSGTDGSGGNGTLADRNNNPGNIRDGSFAKSLPGYIGQEGGFAKFDTSQNGQSAQVGLLNSYLSKGYDTPSKIAARWAPAGDGSNNPIVYAQTLASSLGIGVNDKVTADQLPTLAAAQAKQEGYHTSPQSMRQDMMTTATAIANYDSKITARQKAGPRGEALQAMIRQVNPNYDETQYDGKDATVKDFAVKNGNVVTSLNVAVQHLDTLQAAADALHNGNVRVFNSLGNSFAAATGQAAPTNFAAVKQLVMNEVIKATTGSSGGVDDRQSAQKLMDGANSESQIAGAIYQIKQLMGGQLMGKARQYQANTMRSDFAAKYLNPHTAAVLGFNNTYSPTGTTQTPTDIHAIMQKYAAR